MTPATASALVTVSAAFLVGLVWRLGRGEFRDIWLLCLPVAVLAVAALLAPDHRLWELAGCMAAVAALSVYSFVRGGTAVPAGALGPPRDPDAADAPFPPGGVRRARPHSSRNGRVALAALILINVAIAGAALLRSAGWYAYGASQSFAASQRCLRHNGGGGAAAAGASAGYGRHVLALSTPGGLHGSAVFLDSSAAARGFASDMAASTSLHAMQRGPMVLVTPLPVRGQELRRLGSCLQVVEVERLSDAVGAPFTRVRHPFGQARRAHR